MVALQILLGDFFARDKLVTAFFEDADVVAVETEVEKGDFAAADELRGYWTAN